MFGDTLAFIKEMVNSRNVICKMCCGAIKHTGNTTNLSCHLKRRHGVNVIERSPSAPVVRTSGGAAANPVLVLLCGVHVIFPQAENVTCDIRHITPRDTRRKPKYIYLLRKMTKIIVVHSDLNKYFNLITGLEKLTIRLLVVVRLE